MLKEYNKYTGSIPPPYLIAAIAPRVEVRAQVDFQPAVAEMLDADLEVEGKLVQIEAEAVGLYQIPAASSVNEKRRNTPSKTRGRKKKRKKKKKESPLDVPDKKNRRMK